MSESVKLALIADIHHGEDGPTKRGSEALHLLDAALADLTARTPDLLVDLGDRITDQDPETDAARLGVVAGRFRAVRLAREHLPGNHDVAHTPIETSEEILQAPLRHRALELGGWKLVFWCADVTYEPYVGGLTLTREDLAWLEQALGEDEGPPVVIFTHVPLDDGSMVGNYHFESRPGGRAGYTNAHLARALIERSGRVALAVAGHAHWNALNTIDGVHYLTVHSLTETFTTHPEPAAAWTEIELGAWIDVRVHGNDPIELRLRAKEPGAHWLAHGGKGRPPLRRDTVAERVWEGRELD